MNQYTILKAILRDKNDNTLFVKGKWAYTDVTIVSQLLKIVDLIKPFYAAETVLLERMIYKNKNQHQRARYYKRIQQILKRIRAVDISELMEWIKATFPTTEEATQVANPTPRSTWEHHALYVLYKLYGLTLYLTELNEYILSAYDLLAHQLEQTYFMALALAFITCLARFYNLHHRLLHHVTLLYDLIVTRVTSDHASLLARESPLMTRVKLFQQLIGALPSSLHVVTANVPKKKKKKKQLDQLLTRVTQSVPSESESRHVNQSAVHELHKSLRALTNDDEDMGEALVAESPAVSSFTEPSFTESQSNSSFVSSPGRGVKRKREEDTLESSENRKRVNTNINSISATAGLRTEKADVVKTKKPKHGSETPTSARTPPMPQHKKPEKPIPIAIATPPRTPVKAQIPSKDVNSIFASLLSGKKKKK